jgi:hypothetical protein
MVVKGAAAECIGKHRGFHFNARAVLGLSHFAQDVAGGQEAVDVVDLDESAGIGGEAQLLLVLIAVPMLIRDA